mmetsp:Transcript_28411/g.41815  ORF Transcript_28411/g.41815 Transcript_28411/m.41815 type:complete len:95 (+) Transcript_28411:122-406(+)
MNSIVQTQNQGSQRRTRTKRQRVSACEIMEPFLQIPMLAAEFICSSGLSYVDGACADKQDYEVRFEDMEQFDSLRSRLIDENHGIHKHQVSGGR